MQISGKEKLTCVFGFHVVEMRESVLSCEDEEVTRKVDEKRNNNIDERGSLPMVLCRSERYMFRFAF